MCNWKSKYLLRHVCNEPALEGNGDGRCILHSTREDKDPGAFKKKVEERMAGKDKIDLRGCYFPGGFDYTDIKRSFDVPVDFSETTFSEQADFSGATFSAGADFTEATFSKEADFNVATFSEKADFIEATFSEDAYFVGATFSEWAYFCGATFSEGADFIGTTFHEGADFRGAKFSRADFIGTV